MGPSLRAYYVGATYYWCIASLTVTTVMHSDLKKDARVILNGVNCTISIMSK